MASPNSSHAPVFVVSSENVERSAKLAWAQVRPVAENVSEPAIGRATGFLPSELCYKAMNMAVEEYPNQVRRSS
jgi:hypothetical protein